MGTVWRIAEEYRHEYILRFAAELSRARAKGELKQNVFSKRDWINITSLMSDPEEYYRKRVYPASVDPELCEYMNNLFIENRLLQAEIKKIRSSWTFRVGQSVMFIPRKLKKIFFGGK